MRIFTLPKLSFIEKLPKLPVIEKWAKLPLVYRTLITLGTVVLLSAVYIGSIYLPQKDKRDNLEMEIKNTQSQLQNFKRRARDINKLKAELAEKEIKLKEILRQLPDQKEIPNLLTNISNVGKESGLEFLVFKPKPEIPKEFYAEIPIDISVSGSYHNVAMFFDKISKLPRIICITNLSMGEAKPSERQMILKTNCVVTTYKYVEISPEELQKK